MPDKGLALYRRAKFTSLYLPIVLSYVRTQKRMKRVRAARKASDPAGYYAERDATWDAQHEAQAAAIRRVFERMGGLYNKTAQSMASREGIVPHAWIQEVSPSPQRDVDGWAEHFFARVVPSKRGAQRVWE